MPLSVSDEGYETNCGLFNYNNENNIVFAKTGKNIENNGILNDV